MKHLLKTAVNHGRRENLAANAAGAVGDDWLLFEVVVLAAFELTDEIVGGIGLGHDGVLELADFGLKSVAAVEKDHLVATLLDQFVDLGGLQVLAAVGYARLIDLDLIWAGKSHQFFAGFHAQPRKIFAGALRPLEIDLSEARKLLCGTNILF